MPAVYTIDDWQTSSAAVQYTTTGPTLTTNSYTSGVWVNNVINGYEDRNLSMDTPNQPGFSGGPGGTFDLRYGNGNYAELVYVGNGSTCSSIQAPTNPVDATASSATQILVPVTMVSGIDYQVEVQLTDSSSNTATVTGSTTTGTGAVQNHTFLYSAFTGVTASSLDQVRIRVTRTSAASGTSATGSVGTIVAQTSGGGSTAFTIDAFSVVPLQLYGNTPPACLARTASADNSWWGATGASVTAFRIRLNRINNVETTSAQITGSALTFNLQRTGQPSSGNKDWDVVVSYTRNAGNPSVTYDLTQGGTADRFLIPVTMASGVPYWVRVAVGANFTGQEQFVSNTGNGLMQNNEILFSGYTLDMTVAQRVTLYIQRQQETAGTAAIGTVGTFAGADPHVLCLDNTRVDVYEPGFYRLLDRVCGAENVVCNIEVQRNERNEDFIHRAWVVEEEEGAAKPFCVRFDADKRKAPVLEEGDASRFSALSKRVWSIKMKEIEILFEPLHRSVGTRFVEKEADEKEADDAEPFIKAIGGGECLANGRVRRIESLRNTDKGPTRTIISKRFDHNALLCGSNDPHVVTLFGQRLNISNGCFRLLSSQDGKWGANVRVDERGLLHAVRTWHDDKMQELSWDAEQRDPEWLCEMDIVDNDASIMLRAQDGNVVSIAVRGKVNPAWTGAFVGQTIPVESLSDVSEKAQTEALTVAAMPQERIVAKSDASLYAQIMEPHLEPAQA